MTLTSANEKCKNTGHLDSVRRQPAPYIKKKAISIAYCIVKNVHGCSTRSQKGFCPISG